MAAFFLTAPALAHHGKDFLLIETDDMPLPGHVYALLSSDTNIDKDGERSTEITGGFLYGFSERFSIEPHFHVDRTSDQGWHYDAAALELRYRIGNLPNS